MTRRQSSPSGVLVGFVTASALALLSGVEHVIAPTMMRLWQPPEPRELVVMRTDPAIAVGSPVPHSVARYGLPIDLVVHVECIGCRLGEPSDIKAALSEPRVLNLVLADDMPTYKALGKELGGRIARGEPEMIEQLHASFGPRLYRYDKNGRLTYVQANPVKNYGQFLNQELSR